MIKLFRAMAVGAVLVHSGSAALAAESNGSGSTFVYPILAKWASEYQAKTGNKINYVSNGSGAGLQQVKAGTVDFGASDMPLQPDELAKAGLGQFPLVIGAVVPVVNLEGVAPGAMHFTGSVLADIFMGKIKNWNDPALKALNPNLQLPTSAITVVHRTDGSGTTFNFANYLSKVSPEWKATVGQGVALDWPVGVGGKGNEGVAAYVGLSKNTISYVEYAYAVRNKLAYGLVQNRAGRFVQPDAQSFQAAADSADWGSAKDFYQIMTDAPGDNAYPITATSFILLPKQPKEHVRSKVAIDFFRWSLENGGAEAAALNYVPLPASLIDRIGKYLKSDFGA
ncbi:phosphate ABC transporter substrate-binding protein PstS [Tardiphaga robiniae]|uniref:Phosphate-binding protein PstS n=1 Tax=Tardiphaga robiniae TaxID=943830 RepID=A0A163XQG6_9BRAD|nr:phosphate ABC transporter substrate-binding protein PstS [Tardiphaga robiniae]KZD21217.1 phosphate ABC transporter substrate-binding protein [Tardiphaga robiniae]